MRSILLPLCIFISTLVPTTNVNAITEEQRIGMEFCQQQTLTDADKYLTQLAQTAVKKYSIEVTAGRAKYRSMLQKRYKQLNQQAQSSHQAQLDHNLTFRKLLILTMDLDWD